MFTKFPTLPHIQVYQRQLLVYSWTVISQNLFAGRTRQVHIIYGLFWFSAVHV